MSSIEALPDEILEASFSMLPSSNRFIAPISRRFRDVYSVAVNEKKENKTNVSSMSSEAALKTFVREGKEKDVMNLNARWIATRLKRARL